MTRRLLAGAEEIIRSGHEVAGAPGVETPARRRRTFLYFLVCASGYGALMGSFGGFAGDRSLVVGYAALKVPLLLLVTGAVCLPSFFVLNTLFGLRDDFGQVLRALLLTQAGFAIFLLALSPYTLLWYASSADYNSALFFNALIFGVASLAAQWLLHRHYQPLFARHPRHRLLHKVWLVLFAFVGIQSAWVLRPFVGAPGLPAQFFRSQAWGNAYVELAAKVREMISPSDP